MFKLPWFIWWMLYLEPRDAVLPGLELIDPILWFMMSGAPFAPLPRERGFKELGFITYATLVI